MNDDKKKFKFENKILILVNFILVCCRLNRLRNKARHVGGHSRVPSIKLNLVFV